MAQTGPSGPSGSTGGTGAGASGPSASSGATGPSGAIRRYGAERTQPGRRAHRRDGTYRCDGPQYRDADDHADAAPAPTGTPQSDVEAARSEFLTSLPGYSDISHNANVWITNAILAFVTMIIIFLTSEIFNQTLRDNQDDIEGWLQRFFGPFIMLWAGLSFAMGVASAGSQKLR